ncbi:sigma-70 family RNA polymerase sigma factor [Asticcacaulis sp. BYS171W]|uniref:RNA polymerase sigma factor n=1 Tax=Asticcacaulis aquaticus TaxID=2984212 RepID=A0ABT5HV77_9CAUL|nr:sigma-70 family RNA polymerase sigma factor [Asticcacaulis aquaticus]MDC7683954.1 sigma-70 family RNA polymerase sigma factor [Asticcacaulis aquaticus]
MTTRMTAHADKKPFDPDTFLGSSVAMIVSDHTSTGRADGSPEALIVRIAATRDRDAYAQLFTLYAPKLKAFMMGRGLSANEAEDLAQDALLSVWRKAGYFDPSKAAATTWIYAIARNLHIDGVRKQKRARDLPEDLWAPEPDAAADVAVIGAEDARTVAVLIDTLPPEQIEVIRLSFFEDLSHGDIATALSIPLGTVKSRLRLAMMRLRTAFDTGTRV